MVPLYGMYQIRKDLSESEPSLEDVSSVNYLLRDLGIGVYHAAWGTATLLGALVGLEKLLQ